MEKRIIDPNYLAQSKKILRSFSLPHVDLRKLKLVNVDSNISEDSYDDSGIEAGDSNIQQDYPSLASGGVIGQDYPTNDSQGPEESAQESCKNLSILFLFCHKQHICQSMPLSFFGASQKNLSFLYLFNILG